ncbi:zinc finger protein 507 [Alosa sapidissima]|uniref:zinc finger protein 507 n=1 Tax=Alosa sapidissima TaxID=34773 RepID=UPI001C09B06B|nr:zinc finger protein 507 [Alosa sapidissima]
MEDSSGVAVLIPHARGQQDAVFIPDRMAASMASCLQGSEDEQARQQPEQQQQHHRQAADSLIQVIEKLSKIVEKRPRRWIPGRKRLPLARCVSPPASPTSQREASPEPPSPCKRVRQEEAEEADGAEAGHTAGSEEVVPSEAVGRTVTCYQCSLCRFLSPTLVVLREHLRQHNEQHSELLLMCSECRFTSSRQDQLEAHVRQHLERAEAAARPAGGTEPSGRAAEDSAPGPAERGNKWYSYECGTYRCLICSYTCVQQRMLKTHAWKHAGLVDCSYPIFEDEAEQQGRRDAPVAPTANYSAALPHLEEEEEEEEEAIVLLAAVGEKPQALHSAPDLQIELCGSVGALCGEGEKVAGVVAVKQSLLDQEAFSSKDHDAAGEPVLEVQVATDTEPAAEVELEPDGRQAGGAPADSLLSSAQKIISSRGNSAGHVNVIVERLPCAEAPVTSKPLLLSPEVGGDKNLLAAEEVELDSQPHAVFYQEPEEVVMDVKEEQQQEEEEEKESGCAVELPRDENVPPARRRTHSESLRLHSLAAEVLVAMPTRAPELSRPGVKVTAAPHPQSPDTGQRPTETLTVANHHHRTGPSVELALGVAVPDSLLEQPREDALAEGGPTKAGISMSLLTVIERLRERSDQNASDEDILKELQDNAQSQPAGSASGAASAGPGGGGGGATVADPALLAEGGLVEFVAGSERPYRCRLCLYSSDNKGYLKQHLRVHRQKQPYQCPICEHVARDSKDLESHTLHHCKTRTYPCKQCSKAFYYKSQLRSHERDQHGVGDATATLTPLAETTAMVVEESDRTTEEVPDPVSTTQRVYKCDVCDYTSSTYVGVRNHRRIHNSDKPYRCCSCDFATTNMNSLKSHMKRHPLEHQAVQLLEQYRCSLCGYVCSHPPSLKSHMWKHAGDQNYNYEQVNKAINEAISQSGRSPTASQKAPAVAEPKAEASVVLLSRQENLTAVPSGPARPAIPGEGTAGSCAWERSEGGGGGGGGSSSSSTLPPAAKERAGLEYCMLLFCCCICGFESTSKEQLLEHMKEHEGDIISIILNKEQQQQQQPPSLPAEGSVEP